MKIIEMQIKDLKPLVDGSTESANEKLLHSVSENGVMQPLIINGKVLCDGHRRLDALRQLGRSVAPCIEAAGSPALLFAQLNSHRELSAMELTAAYASCEPSEHTEMLKLADCTDSPQLRLALHFIGCNLLCDPDLCKHSLPMNIWRELAHLGDDMKLFAGDLLTMPGTVSEKRNIAMFLRQAQRKGVLPEKLPGSNAAEALEQLQKLAQPRRTEALAKFARALEQNPLPPGFSLKIDETFSKQGMLLTCNLTRRHSGRLTEAQTAVDAIFTAVEEL
jgi:hypothetical protein